jgi:rhodanese-related sulfurtransferase
MPIRETTVHTLATALAAPLAPPMTRVLDVRTEGEHTLASLPCAVLIPLHELHGRAAELIEGGWSYDDRVFVLCHHGVRSRTGAAILESLGFLDVASVTGGIDAWSLHVDPTIPRYT